MWGDSRTPEAMLSKDQGDVTSFRTTLRSIALRPEGERVEESAGDRRRGVACCLGCCGKRPRGSAVSDKDKDKTKRTNKPGGKYTAADNMDRESGISCLSQFSDIPRVDGEGKATTSGPANKGKAPSGQSPAQERWGRCTRKLVQIFFSFVGLTVFVAAYSIGGGFLFAYLEKDNEVKVHMDVVKTRTEAVNSLWNTTFTLNVFHEEEWKRRADDALKDFQLQIYHLTTQGWIGVDEEYNNTKTWDFYNSFLYSITVTTTIGYGNITPKTQLARVLTVLYAIIGIPLCFLWLSTLGSYMAVGVRFLYLYLCRFCTWICCGCCKQKRPPPRQKEGRMDEGGGGEGGRSGNKTKNIPQTVPCYVSLLIITLYIMLGAWLFSQWEGWTYQDAGYFCFITISTIGFGDFVPGFDSFDKGKTIGNAAYLIVGLALVAMCFQLMQDDVKKSVKRFMDNIRAWSNGEQPTGSRTKVKPRESRFPTGEESEEEFLKVPKDESKRLELKLTKEESKRLEKERKKERKAEEKSAKEEKKRQAQEQHEAQRAEKKAKQNTLKLKNKSQHIRASTSNSPMLAMACESPRYCQNPKRTIATPLQRSASTAADGRPADNGRRLSTELKTSLEHRPMTKGFQSMRALTDVNHSNDEFDTNALSQRDRVSTISGSMANARFHKNESCSYHLVDDLDGCEAMCGVGRKLRSSFSKPNSRLSNINSAEFAGLPPGLTDTVDLLQHMSWERRTGFPCPQESPRRDMSRCPRSAPGEGGNIDVFNEDEEDVDDDDDETLDAESLSSSTDLKKVAQAVRRERQERPLPHPSPAITALFDCPSPLPAFTHPTSNVAMTTFRPPPTGGESPAGSGDMVPSPNPRSPFRCTQSRAKSIASPLIYFQPTSYPPNYYIMSSMPEYTPGYGIVSMPSRDKDYDAMFTSPQSKSYDVMSTSSRPSAAEGEEKESVGEESGCVESADGEILLVGSTPRTPSCTSAYYGSSPRANWVQQQHLPLQQQYMHQRHPSVYISESSALPPRSVCKSDVQGWQNAAAASDGSQQRVRGRHTASSSTSSYYTQD